MHTEIVQVIPARKTHPFGSPLERGKITYMVDQQFTKGSHEYVWNASSYSSGVYFFRLEANGFSQTVKALLLK